MSTVLTAAMAAAMAAASFTGRHLQQKQECREDDDGSDPSHQHHAGQPLRLTLRPTQRPVNVLGVRWGYGPGAARAYVTV
jgi:hypothetical protein